ncbi:BTAD domain-containing putative transcriptional regulator [Kitasatospora sp. NPDC056651]|uniref:BTAD domain-containing putative transcriptional regulator n=1 Tax=Kitasatospora sp. NPDC056651 TaxID=3345892 RepID=UPI0036815487
MNGSIATFATIDPQTPEHHSRPAPAPAVADIPKVAGVAAREAFHVSLLGTPAIWLNGEPMHIRGDATRRVLVHLVLTSPHVIPNHRLIESTWGGSEPDSAIDQIRKIISKLRQSLPGGKDLIRTEPGGYRITLNARQSDVVLWRDAIRQARALLHDGDDHAAMEQLSDALDLWRGPALDGLEGHPFATESVSLHEERDAALEAWCRLAVKDLGAPAVITRLRREVAQRPLQERLWEILMTTLAGSGRVLEAMDEFNNLRKILSNSLGVRPSPQLEALYRTLQATANTLAPAPAAQPPAPPAARFPVPAQRRPAERLQPAERLRPRPPGWIKDLLRGQEPNPGFVMDSRWNVLHRNHAMARWFPSLAEERANIVSWALTDPSARATLHGWDVHARRYVGMLKLALSHRPDDPFLRAVLNGFKEQHGRDSALLAEAVEAETWENHRFTLNLGHISPAPVQVVSHLLTADGNPDLRVILLVPSRGHVVF